MKARIKDTGEVINVKFSLHPNPSFERHYWYCYENKEAYDERELDFLDDEKSDTKKIDWEQRRYEIAKEAMNGLLSAPVVEGIDPNPSFKDIATYSVRLADAIIEELKVEKQNETSTLHP